MKIRWIDLHIVDDEGKLTIGEGESTIPFSIKRFYVIARIDRGAVRGFHANKKSQQVIFCLTGSVTVILDDGKKRQAVVIDTPYRGLFVDTMIWNELIKFTPGTTLLVVASTHFREKDYIRDYKTFRALKKNTP
jgi:dTDP-4-dehydrorhamnose 3,5-epimerase-like enzyme